MPAFRRPDGRLILDSPEFTVRAENFANLMSAQSFQDEFFRDPAGMAAQELGLQVETASLSAANRLTYSLLIDPGFNDWAQDFQRRVADTLPAAADDLPSLTELVAVKKKVQEEFTESVRAHLTPDAARIFDELDPGVLVAEGDVAIVLLTFVALIVIVVIAAGVARPDEALSRKSIQLVVNQLDGKQVEQILQGAELNR